MTNLPGRKVSNMDSFEHAGDWCFIGHGGEGVTRSDTGRPVPYTENAAVSFMCPCGCGTPGCVPIMQDLGGSAWQWDGNKEEPTLIPSILRMQGCKWHGFFTKGIWVTC